MFEKNEEEPGVGPFSPIAKHFYSFGRKPWSSGYGRRIFAPKVLSSNPSTIYWMDIFSYLIDVKIVMCI